MSQSFCPTSETTVNTKQQDIFCLLMGRLFLKSYSDLIKAQFILKTPFLLFLHKNKRKDRTFIFPKEAVEVFFFNFSQSDYSACIFTLQLYYVGIWQTLGLRIKRAQRPKPTMFFQHYPTLFLWSHLTVSTHHS